MPRSPKGKALTTPSEASGMSTLWRIVAPYENINSLDANLWRYVARKQPVIMDCITTLKMHAQGLMWDIRARDSDRSDELKDDIEKHKDILRTAQEGDGWLNYLDLLLDDFYTVPFGGATETIRYSDGSLYSIRRIDGGTLSPTENALLPVRQKIGASEPLFFNREEMVRMYSSPRPEIERRGWGMTPVERVYLAVDLLGRGDRYYANLLLDTPEAGLLDLGNMSEGSATKWLESFKNLFTGIDGFKIPVIYEHDTPAKYIPFNRPPTEMMFDEITMKYIQLVCAAFGLTIGDIGIVKQGGGGGLGAAVRADRHSRATGFSHLKGYITEHVNSFFPDELEFWFIDMDDELLVAKGRARSANGVAFRNLVEGGILTPKEARKQIKADGLITIPLTEDPDNSDFDIVKEISGVADQIKLQEDQLAFQKTQANKASALGSGGRPNGQGGVSLGGQRNVRGTKLESVQGKTPAPVSQGGASEVKSEITERSTTHAKFQDILLRGFAEIGNNSSPVRIRRILKAATKLLYPTLKSLASEDYPIWKAEYQSYLFGLLPEFINELVTKATNENLQELEMLVQKDRWWEIDLDASEIADLLQEIYASGLKEAAIDIQEKLYEDGLTNTPTVRESFTVEDDALLAMLLDRADYVVKSVNDGTLYYISRLSLGTIAEVLENPELSSVLDASESVDDFLNNDLVLSSATQTFFSGLESILETRTHSIPDFENHRMYESAKLSQYSHVGFTRKMLVHVGNDVPCDVCQTNLDLGVIPIDQKYITKMGYESSSPDFHPGDHCVLTFDKSELPNVKTDYQTGRK